ncbi:hypothetical protein NL529_32440, partial [Klebsiella pneumoniae]|nr:hypothetical protein [Klebsiella pneumoniae]
MSLRSDKQKASRRAGKQERQPLLNLSAFQPQRALRQVDQHAQEGSMKGNNQQKAQHQHQQQPESANAEPSR